MSDPDLDYTKLYEKTKDEDGYDQYVTLIGTPDPNV
jgi:hypothetical protein